jgi:transposase
MRHLPLPETAACSPTDPTWATTFVDAASYVDRTAEHPFATLKMRMGATHFLMKTLPRAATEMALHVLAYNLTRVMNIMGVQPLMAAIKA